MKAPDPCTSTPTSAWIAARANWPARPTRFYYETDLPEDEQRHLADNAAFFSDVLPGRDRPLGSPGGTDKLGLGVDTPLVAALPPRGE